MSDQSNAEREYFALIEVEKKRRLATQLAGAEADRVAAELKELHYLHCGKCGQEMMTTHFKGVEIEVCPGCGAVLLDPGELEELAGEDRSGVVRTLSSLLNFRSAKS